MMTSGERPADTVILRAADLAEQAANRATQGGRVVRVSGGIDGSGEGWSQVEVDFGPQQPGLTAGCILGDVEEAEADALLIAASDPDHWRDVAATLRGQVKWHVPRMGHCSICDRYGTPCSGLTSLLPLANGIIAKLDPANTTGAVQ